MRAIVIDDSGATRSILRRILVDYGFAQVLEAENAEVGLLQLRDSGPLELCLVDLNMPGMNGHEFIKEIRADSAFDDMTVMMVTTEVDPQQMARALAAGANEYIMKPFTPESVVDKLVFFGLTKDVP